jgi:ParB-like chromosome segregation protein Spo0J
MDLQSIPVDRLSPNPWSPNRLDKAQFESLLDDVARRGQILKPVVVRPEEGGRYLILDGEHQWRAARDAGLVEVPCQVLDADEFEARRATIRRNLHGTDCPLRFGRLCAEMQTLRPELSGRALAKELGVDPRTIRDGLVYVRLAEIGAARGWSSDEEIAALPVREARALLKRLEQGDEPQEEGEAPAVDVAPPAKYSHTVKAIAKKLVELADLCGKATIEERAVVWREGGQRYIEGLGHELQAAAAEVAAAQAAGEPEPVVRQEVTRDVPQVKATSKPEPQTEVVEAAPEAMPEPEAKRAAAPEGLAYGQRLKAAREARGLASKEVAEAVGVSTSAVQKFQNGRARPGVETRAKLAEVLEDEELRDL